MAGVSSHRKRTRCSLCGHRCAYAQVIVSARCYDGLWRRLQILCQDCAAQLLRLLQMRPYGVPA